MAKVSISKWRGRDGRVRFRVRAWVRGVRTSLGLFETEDEANDCKTTALEDLATEPTEMTVTSWGAKWLNARELDGQHRAVAHDRSVWAQHVDRMWIGEIGLRRLTRVHVVRWLDELVRKRATKTIVRRKDAELERDLEWRPSPRSPGLVTALAPTSRQLSRSAVVHALNLLRKCLSKGADLGHVPTNVAAGVRVEMRDASSREKWTWLRIEEIAALERLPLTAGDTRNTNGSERASITALERAVFVVAIYTGLREGELWGLRWRDVHLDSDRPHVVVRHSYATPTKSGKVREVPLLAPALAALRAWRDRAPGIGSALVWPSDDGASFRPGFDAGWPAMRERLAIARPVRFHDLRHTCASHLIQGTWGRAWSLHEIRDLLGHSSIKVTERYAHLAPGNVHDAARATPASGQQVVSTPPVNIEAARRKTRDHSRKPTRE